MSTTAFGSRTAVAIVALIALAAPLAAPAQGASADPHVASVEQLLGHLDLANTSYEHGPGHIDWSGTVASHTDCSGLIDQLLMHDDGLDADALKRWFGSRRPTARRYHDAIVGGRGFERMQSVADLRAGDLIAIEYLTRHDNTGHVMLVAGAAERRPASPPLVEGTEQWSVDVIDSSESGHGATDTRHKRGPDGKDHDGLGRGVFRLYTDAQGRIAGFSWSTLKGSHFTAPADEHLVLGRFLPGYRP